MDIPLLDIINKLNVLDIIVLAIVGLLIAYCFFSNKVHVLMFLLVLMAALVSSTIPIISSIASLTRWLLLPMILIAGLIFSRVRIPFNILMFWGYVLLGFISLFRADYFIWQFQRSILLMTAAVAIPIAYSGRDLKSYKLSLTWIALAAAVYSFINFVDLPSSLMDPSRYAGYTTSAPAMAATLGALLPFTLWGLGMADSKWAKRICGLGFLLGTVTLIFSAQRAGTIAGVVGLIPLLLTIFNQRKAALRIFLLLIFLILMGYFLLLQSSPERVTFLLNRYTLNAGLSNREYIWQKALSEIAVHPFIGNGVGAAEILISGSFHNAYLEIWYNTGLLGLAFFLISQIYFLYRIFYLGLKSPVRDLTSISALSLGYIGGFIVLSLFESIGAGASNLNLILYLFLGVLVEELKRPMGTLIPSSTQPYPLNTELKAVR
jgi:O-antigen ligase